MWTQCNESKNPFKSIKGDVITNALWKFDSKVKQYSLYWICIALMIKDSEATGSCKSSSITPVQTGVLNLSLFIH